MHRQNTKLMMTDRAGSIISSSTNSKIISYGPFGVDCACLLRVTKTGFCGTLRENETGTYIFGNGYRTYNPSLMRFDNPDLASPFGKGGINAYVYTLGDPINHIDLSGQSAQSLSSKMMATLHGRRRVAPPVANIRRRSVEGLPLDTEVATTLKNDVSLIKTIEKKARDYVELHLPHAFDEFSLQNMASAQIQKSNLVLPKGINIKLKAPKPSVDSYFLALLNESEAPRRITKNQAITALNTISELSLESISKTKLNYLKMVAQDNMRIRIE